MKTIYFLLFLGLSVKTFGQCSPDTAITNNYLPTGTLSIPAEGFLKPTSFYVYPGLAFEKVITAMAPQQTTINNPIGFPPTISVNINWIRLTNLNNLPSWMSYQCGGQLDPNDPCKMAYPTWSCVSAFTNTPDGKVPMTETPGTIYNIEVIVDADVQTIGTQSNYNGGSLTLFVLDSMTLDLVYDPCNGGKIEAITHGAFNEPEAINFTWSTGESTSQIVPTQQGWYHCLIKDQLTGWEANDSVYVDAIYPSINLQLNTLVAPTTQNNGSISVTATGGVQPLTYSWTGPNNFTSNQSSIANLSGGNYIVTVTDSADCSITQSYHLSAASISENDIANYLSIYPNPTSGFIYLENKSSKNLVLNLTNIEGRIISTITLEINQLLQYDVTHLEQGIYFINEENGVISKKMVIKD